MSLARAMTKRMKRTAAPEDKMPSRSKSVKNPTLLIDRSQISLPVALLSTTNTLVYDAPDLASMDFGAMRGASSSPSSSPSSSASHSSADDSDHSVSGRSRASSHGSRDTLTDASSVESSPTSPSPNHLSGYFPAPTPKALRKSASTTSLTQLREHPAEPVEPVPAIPQRALSHSKRAHVQLAHKRSMQNLPHSSRGTSISSRGSLGSLREQRSSLDMFSGAGEGEERAPFAAELAQLNEVAEEFCSVARSAEDDADVQILRARGLATFCAADYLAEIAPLFADLVAPRMAWI